MGSRKRIFYNQSGHEASVGEDIASLNSTPKFLILYVEIR